MLIGILATSPLADANGGGYSFGIAETGQVSAFDLAGVAQVQIEEEDLKIHLLPTEAVVKVRYLLKNTGKKTKVRFGFPVESEPLFSSLGSIDEPLDSTKTPPGISDYRVTLDGKKLSAAWAPETADQATPPQELKGLAVWLVSEAKFPAKSDLVLEISYRVMHSGSEYSISDDTLETARSFHYRFSTGAVWQGPIAKGLVTITVDESISRSGMEIVKPVNRYQKTQSGWAWAFENFEPTLADDLQINVTPQIETRWLYGDDAGDHQAYVKRGSVWSLEHCGYEVKASSTLPSEGKFTYKPEHLKEWGSETTEICWSEGATGSGVGEWLEFTPKKASRMTGIRIAGGYQDYNRAELFTNNARPKTIELILNDEHRQTLSFLDEPDSVLFWIDGYSKPVESCKLIITAVYPGSRFEDLCLTQVSLLSYLEKEPEIQGAR